MTLQHLKYVLTVAEKGSISEAAREWHISQASLSNAIKEVEKELCFPVFTRNCKCICRNGADIWTGPV